jgi:hypothetical protein
VSAVVFDEGRFILSSLPPSSRLLPNSGKRNRRDPISPASQPKRDLLFEKINIVLPSPDA